ncbi:MAG: sigma 54-interacting transcriptional regulator [Myxococcaceae bacterium]|nr:sigma 54-interacting transcriptional regulator [Myxococcaceae bacterium]
MNALTWTQNAAAEASVDPVWLEVVEGPGKGTQCLLSAGTAFVGSAETCDLQLADRLVSRRHLSVELLPGKVRVVDLQSKNGTRYLGAHITDALVPVGGTVHLGQSAFRLVPTERQRVEGRLAQLPGMVGTSAAARRLFAVLERAAPGGATVLLKGESGSGKHSAARALHLLSARGDEPFISFACGAANPHLIESELFGHVKGAFTGATHDRQGLVEAVGNGTLVLEDVSSLPLGLQPKLLRLLESRDFLPVGATRPSKARMRVVCLTHVDLEDEVRAGRFRADLYYRLAVVVIDVPPLRERREDIPLLARHFAQSLKGVDVELRPSTLAAMQCDDWPGNLRELRNAVERALTLGETPFEAPESGAPSMTFRAAREQLLAGFERDYLATLLRMHQGNVSKAAKAAGLARSAFYRMLQRNALLDR